MAFPAPLDLPQDEFALEVKEWSREELLHATPLTLLDLLARELPELTPLRAEFFSGPHYLMDGVLGPGFVEVRLDGRRLLGLESGAVDLVRIPLATLERLRVVRTAEGVRVEALTVRHRQREAYSRIEGATGRPDLNLLRGVFTNGLGEHFTVGAALDFLNTEGIEAETNRLDAWGNLSWMPAGRGSGVELIWRSESVDRTVDGTTGFDRKELLLHGRADLLDGVQAELWAGTTTRDVTVEGLVADDTAAVRPTVERVEARVVTRGDREYVVGNVRVLGGTAHPRVSASLDGGVRALPWLALNLSGEIQVWDPFLTAGARGGVSLSPDLGLGLSVRAGAATGTRGVARPGSGLPDSVAYDALAARARVRLGPYGVAGGITYQVLSRQLPFGGEVDGGLPAGPEAEVVGFEGEVDGPLLPVGGILEEVRVTGGWRRLRRESAGALRYVPSDRWHIGIAYGTSFFEGNLELSLRGDLLHRGAILSVRPETEVEEVAPAFTLAEGEVVVRIDTFRLWWRGRNPFQAVATDFPGRPYPLNHYVVGVKWEFFN